MLVKLKVQDMCLELDPAAGGSVRALRHRDLDVLRPGPERSGPAFDALELAAFPMVPFVGRIHNAIIKCDDGDIALPANFPPEPNAIHGHGWQDAWTVESTSETTASLLYKHCASAWPWDYEARQTFELYADALNLELSVTNTGTNWMPAGLGWHPYFVRKGATLCAPTTSIWTPDETTGDNVPSPVDHEIDLSVTRAVEDLRLDTTFSVGASVTRLTWPTHSVEMTSDPIFQHVTVYVPCGEDYFCVEPISHAPNSVNSELDAAITGQKWLEPGETLSGRIVLKIDRA